jgi:hypothetical protein
MLVEQIDSNAQGKRQRKKKFGAADVVCRVPDFGGRRKAWAIAGGGVERLRG